MFLGSEKGKKGGWNRYPNVRKGEVRGCAMENKKKMERRGGRGRVVGVRRMKGANLSHFEEDRGKELGVRGCRVWRWVNFVGQKKEERA